MIPVARRLVARRLAALGVVTAVGLGVANGPAAAGPARSATGRWTGEITVSAAASLGRSLDQIGVAFHRAHPGVTVRVNPGASSALAAQILSGEPVDVYVSADLANMDRLVAAGAVATSPVVLARNSMTVVVKPGNPRKVSGVADLAGLPVVALCAPTVPCGVYARSVLDRARVTIPEAHVTRGADATATVGAVATGDADAAIVYRTDARSAGPTVTRVAIPADQNETAVYPIAPLAASPTPKVAAAFVRFAGSAEGRKILARNGFLAP